MGEVDLGGSFWLGLLGICVGAVVAGAILFVLFGWAWSAFGFIGALIVLGALAVGFAYVHDRREQNRRRCAAWGARRGSAGPARQVGRARARLSDECCRLGRRARRGGVVLSADARRHRRGGVVGAHQSVRVQARRGRRSLRGDASREGERRRVGQARRRQP